MSVYLPLLMDRVMSHNSTASVIFEVTLISGDTHKSRTAQVLPRSMNENLGSYVGHKYVKC